MTARLALLVLLGVVVTAAAEGALGEGDLLEGELTVVETD